MKKLKSDINNDVIRDTEEPNILPCEMTGQELEDEYKNLMRIMQDMDDLERQRKAVASDFKSRKDKLDEMLEESRKKIRSKQIMRSIMCTLKLNFTKLLATLIRHDTGEQVNERPMNNDERRMLNATHPLPGMEYVDERRMLNATHPLPGMEDVDELRILTDPPEGEPLTEDEASAHATDKFGPNESDDEYNIETSDDDDAETWGGGGGD